MVQLDVRTRLSASRLLGFAVLSHVLCGPIEDRDRDPSARFMSFRTVPKTLDHRRGRMTTALVDITFLQSGPQC